MKIILLRMMIWGDQGYASTSWRTDSEYDGNFYSNGQSFLYMVSPPSELVPGAKKLRLATCCLLLATCCLLLAACYLLLATCCLRLACDLRLATCDLLLCESQPGIVALTCNNLSSSYYRR